MTPKRVPAGTRSGGQFAVGGRTSPAISLGDDHDDDATDANRDDPSSGSAIEIRRDVPDGQVLGETDVVRGVPADRPDGTPAVFAVSPRRLDRVLAASRSTERTYFPAGGTVSHVDPRDGSHVVTSGYRGGRCTRRGVVARRASWAVPPVGPNGTWQAKEPRFEELRDGPGGEPAVSYARPDGTVSSTTRYTGGAWTHTVDYFPDGHVAVVFSNTDNPVVRGFPAGDRVWADIGLDGGQWQGVHPNDALLFSGAGVTPDEAREWARDRTGMSAPTALKWRRQGVSTDRAASETARRRAERGRSGPN